MDRQASVRGLLGELAALLADARRPFALYTLLLGGLAALGVLAGLTETAAGTLSYGFSVDEDDTLESALFDLASAVLSVVGTYLLLTRLLAARGRFEPGSTRFWHYLGMAILSAIAIGLGFLLLIVPGVILLVRWSASSGFLIGSRQGVTTSLGSSWAATKGHGWSIFLASIVLLAALVVALVIGGAIGELAGDQVGGVLSAFIEAATGGLFAAFGIAVYCRVHDDARRIGEVFA